MDATKPNTTEQATENLAGPLELILTIPDGVPAPKFDMFQRVRYCQHLGRRAGKHIGCIVGIKYICALDAIVQKIDYGWFYDISFLYKNPPETAFSSPEYQYEVPEECIHALDEGEDNA